MTKMGLEERKAKSVVILKEMIEIIEDWDDEQQWYEVLDLEALEATLAKMEAEGD